MPIKKGVAGRDRRFSGGLHIISVNGVVKTAGMKFAGGRDGSEKS